MHGQPPSRLKLTRELVGRLPAKVELEGPVQVERPGDEYYEGAAATVLAAKAPDVPLWVFAIGSLIWNPRFEVAERRPALVKGWHRSFCLGPTLRWRGNPDAPGRMLSLDRGGECWGLALRMAAEAPDAAQEALTALLKTEPPVPPTWVVAETDAGPVDAIAFTIDDTFPLYSLEPGTDELADILASAVGKVGTMAEYLLNTVIELEKAGIHDDHLWRMQEMVAERLERLVHGDLAALPRGAAEAAAESDLAALEADVEADLEAGIEAATETDDAPAGPPDAGTAHRAR